MIEGWLEPISRETSGFSFNVIDLQEDKSSVPTHTELASLLREAYWGEEYLSILAGRYGWEAVKDRFVQARAGTRLTVRRGDFGEALAAQYLREVEQYTIPVTKLRFKITANQTLPGTDCIAIKLQDDRLIAMCYIESKFRKSLDLSVAVAGVTQLKQDADTAIPEILTFVARRLNDSNSELAEIVEEYIFSRNIDLDNYKLLVFQEKDSWDERVLQNLNDEEVGLNPLDVYVARIDNIIGLSDDTFGALGAIEVVDDDN
jgi:hypothetical protein